MIPRQRQLATIRHELPDRVSVDAIAIENVPAIAEHLGIAPAQVGDRLGLDGRPVAAGYTGPLPQAAGGVDWTEWSTPSTGDYGTARPYPLARADTVGQIDAFAWPHPADYDYAGSAAAARSLHERYAVRGPYWRPLFCRVCDLFGMELAMQHLLTDPALFEAALERVFEVTFEYCRRFLDACGDALDILCLGDDFATQRGLMMSPDHWRRFLKPRYARLFELGGLAGKPVWFHSCGDVTAVLPDLTDLGVNVWETVQLHTLPLSPEALKREYGEHLTFFGGINTQRLPFATPDEVREEVRRCVRVLGQGGGYICGPDHHIKPAVPAANAVALFDAATQFGGTGYTRPA